MTGIPDPDDRTPTGAATLRVDDRNLRTGFGDAGAVTLGAAVSAIARHALLVGVFTAAGAGLGYFAATKVEDSYEAIATLILDRTLAITLSGDVEGTNPLEDQAAAATATETIGAIVVIEKALDRLAEGDVAALVVEGGLSPEGEDAGTSAEPADVDIAPISDVSRRQRLTEYVSRNLIVRSNGRSRLIEIVFRAHDPAVSANVVNAVAAAYIDFRLDMRRQLYRNILTSIASEMTQLRTDVMEAERGAQVTREEVRLLAARTDTLFGERRDEAIAESASLYARQREAERTADAAAVVFERLLLDQRNIQMRVSLPDVDLQLFSVAVPAFRPAGPNLRPIIIALCALTGFLFAASIAVTRARRRVLRVQIHA